MEQEIWKDIEGYEGLYQVSNLGRIKSFSKKHKNQKKIKELIRNQKKCKHGYISISFTKNGIVKYFLVHRVIAKAFIPNPNNKPCINHKNAIRNDNRIENLEWCTHSENTQHSWDNGGWVSKKGIDLKHFVKLTEQQVREIRDKLIQKITHRKISKEYNVDESTISDIKRRKSWKHLL